MYSSSSSGGDNQEHGLNVFVVALNWLVRKLNYRSTDSLVG